MAQLQFSPPDDVLNAMAVAIDLACQDGLRTALRIAEEVAERRTAIMGDEAALIIAARIREELKVWPEAGARDAPAGWPNGGCAP